MVAIGALLGALLTVGLMLHFGLDGIARGFAAVGWGGFALVCLAQLALFPLLGSAWTVLAPTAPRPWRPFILGRLLRDGATEILPLSPVGGFVVGGRAAVLAGAEPALVYATTIVDVAMELAAQMAFICLGLSVLAFRHPSATAGIGYGPLAAGLALGVAAATGFIFAQRFALRPLTNWARGFTGLAFLATAEAGAGIIADIYTRPARLALSASLHLCGWLAASAGAWLALHLMGAGIDLPSVIALECLLYAVRSAAFMAPAGLGVQEGAYAVLGPMFGLPAEMALTLSLLKRGRDVAIYAVALAGWQLAEARRGLRQAKA